MARKLHSYQEMLAEEERLTQLLLYQRQLVRGDIQAIRTELRPVTNAASTIKKFFTRKGTQAAATLGIRLVVDGFIKRSLLAKSGWLMRTMVPFFLKNYASHVAADPDKLLLKIKHLFSKNGKPATKE